MRRAGAVSIFCAMLASGCASARAQAPAPSEAASPAPSPTASAPTAENPPSDGRTAFVDGYRAFQARDAARAIAQLKFAVDNFPALGDYALFYLGAAQRDTGDLSGAASTLERLGLDYPQSVLVNRGDLDRAEILLKLGRNAEAAAVAAQLVARGPEPSIEQGARIAQAASGDSKGAYVQAMALRDLYPHCDLDAEARRIAYAMLAANPAVADTNSIAYHRSEADLLLREGELEAAVRQARAGLAMAPEAEMRAELKWMEARALKPDPEPARRALLEYLQIAPRGPAAGLALEALALIYWHEDQYDLARKTFGRLVAQFPGSALAPGAMLRIGRIFEEQKKLDPARTQYRKLAARYPSSEAAAEARFRAPWMLYVARNYRAAATGFADSRARAGDASERDMYDYWHARALEKAGSGGAARAIFEKLAMSTDSNYYPALAARRVTAAAPELPAADAPEPSAGSPPPAAGAAEFHLARLGTLRALGLKDLEPGELRALAERGGDSEAMRRYVLAGFASADAWYDAIVTATRMEKHGQLSHPVAERVRYPRAYWELFDAAATRTSLDPYLVLALARQESLFNPAATSSSNARGLMQLIPSTARKVAAEQGVDPIDLRLYDPELNVRLGTAYLQGLFEMFGGDAFKAVAAYNGGEHAVQKWTAQSPGDDDEWVENIGYRETRDYVKKVIGGRREYILLYRPGGGAQ